MKIIGNHREINMIGPKTTTEGRNEKKKIHSLLIACPPSRSTFYHNVITILTISIIDFTTVKYTVLIIY